MDASDPPFDWRSNLKVHPAADLFPLMSETELKELADDIKQNGLQQAITIMRFEPPERDAEIRYELLDGRNRLDALARLGWLKPQTLSRSKPPIKIAGKGKNAEFSFCNGVLSATIRNNDRNLPDDNAVSRFVVAANIRRRHLTADQKRELIATLLKTQPETSDRRIAETVSADHKTVGKVRAELEATGDIPQLTETVGADGKSRKKPKSDAILEAAAKERMREGGGDKKSANAYYAATEQSDGDDSPTQPTQHQPVDLRINVSLEQWKNLSTDERNALLSTSRSDVKHVPRFNRQENDAIEWAQWSWNPVTGCLHNCPYCYARDSANSARMAKAYPNGFAPSFRPAALLAPRHANVPDEADEDTRYRNVFTCSMADLFGRWVPEEWIEAVLNEIRNAPQFNFLCLTKFPKRMSEVIH